MITPAALAIAGRPLPVLARAEAGRVLMFYDADHVLLHAQHDDDAVDHTPFFDRIIWREGDVQITPPAQPAEHAQDDEGHEGEWKTINGARVFIRSGETPEGALQRRNLTRLRDLDGVDASRELAEVLPAPAQLDQVHVDAVAQYVRASTDLSINHPLRDGSIQHDVQRQLVRRLDAVIATSPPLPAPLTVTRAVEARFVDDVLLPGAEIVDRGYVSTSASMRMFEKSKAFGRGDKVFIDVEVPAGARVLSVPSVVEATWRVPSQRTWFGSVARDNAMSEAEVLLPRGSRFRVLERKGNTVRARWLGVDPIAAQAYAFNPAQTEEREYAEANDCVWRTIGGRRVCVRPNKAQRVERALATHKPSTAEKQRAARGQEAHVAGMIGGLDLDDNEPLDVHGRVAGRRFGVEVKTFLDNTNDKVTMHPESLRRKLRWARQERAALHTVVVDARDRFAGGAHAAVYSGHALYYRRGVGSFRLASMVPVRDAAHLRALVAGEAKYVQTEDFAFDPNQPRDEEGKWTDSGVVIENGRLKSLPKTPSEDVDAAFDDWGARLDDPTQVIAYRTQGSSGDNLGDMAATEGVGPYLAKDRTLAEQFGRAQSFSFGRPKNPIIVKEPLYILQEDARIMQPLRAGDSPWLAASKEAVRRSGTTDENWGKKTGSGALGRALTDTLLDHGHDAVLVKGGTDNEWVVLLARKGTRIPLRREIYGQVGVWEDFAFNPNQPRHPAGTSESGQFAPKEGGASTAIPLDQQVWERNNRTIYNFASRWPHVRGLQYLEKKEDGKDG